MGLLLEEQSAFDAVKFDQPEWQITEWRGQKTRHISHHVSKALVKISTGDTRIIRDEVIPDLSIYRSQLINTHALPEQSVVTAERLGDMAAISRRLGLVVGNLAYYLEPEEHGVVDDDARTSRVITAVTGLHVAAESLAAEYDVDLESAHRTRMQFLLGSM